MQRWIGECVWVATQIRVRDCVIVRGFKCMCNRMSSFFVTMLVDVWVNGCAIIGYIKACFLYALEGEDIRTRKFGCIYVCKYVGG